MNSERLEKDMLGYIRHDLATALAASECVFDYMKDQTFPRVEQVCKIQDGAVKKMKELITAIDKRIRSEDPTV